MQPSHTTEAYSRTGQTNSCVHCRKIISTECKFESFKMTFLYMYLLVCDLLTYSMQTSLNLREKVNQDDDHVHILKKKKKLGMFFNMPL